MAKSRSHATSVITVFQFKITLRHIRPPIWRRIQFIDCTLDRLHEHIQTAMGWTNSHLHQFEIDSVTYGDLELLDDGFGHVGDVEDTRQSRLSDVLARRKKGFRFHYEYDFGDGWEHEIMFEERLSFDPRIKYPICIDGKRACPPEDVGGPGGYAHMLEVLANPKHKEYDEVCEWTDDIDAESFSPADATNCMHEGLPEWNSDD